MAHIRLLPQEQADQGIQYVSICFFWMYKCMVKLHCCSNFRTITFGVWVSEMFRILMQLHFNAMENGMSKFAIRLDCLIVILAMAKKTYKMQLILLVLSCRGSFLFLAGLEAVKKESKKLKYSVEVQHVVSELFQLL